MDNKQGKSEVVVPQFTIIKPEHCATTEPIDFNSSAQVAQAGQPEIKTYPKSKTLVWNTPMHWKTSDGRVTLAIDHMTATAVQALATNGALLEYVQVDVIGHSWNPCDGWCPNLYVHLLNASKGPLKVLDFGHLVGECDAGFHLTRQLGYTEIIFDLIEYCSRSGSGYNWKAC